MKKKSAEELMMGSMEMGEIINRMLKISESNNHNGEMDKYIKSISEIMNVLTVDIIFEIEKEYPDLNPD